MQWLASIYCQYRDIQYLRCVYLCSWMHIMSMLWFIDDEVSSGNCLILFKLNVAICIVCLYFSKFYLSSVANFSNTDARAPRFFTHEKCDTVWTCGSAVGIGDRLMVVLIIIYRSHPCRWAAVVPRSNFSSPPFNCRICTPRT